jgi:hypothetical protein
MRKTVIYIRLINLETNKQAFIIIHLEKVWIKN